MLENLAFDWRSRRVESLGLADYGSKHELLECVSTYEHVVAALNAAAVWMLRRLAEAYRALGREADASAADHEADALRDALLHHLYVEGQVDPERDHAVFAAERHTSNGYPPARGIRMGDHLYIRAWNRETAANPGQTEWYQQLFDLSTDPFCLTNIRTLNPANEALAEQMWQKLRARLIEERDPRMFGLGSAFQGAAEYSVITVTPEDPVMLAHVDTLLAQDNDGDGFQDGVSIHFGGGPDGTGLATIVPPTLTRVGSEFVIEYRRSPYEHFVGLVIEYSFDAGATWSSAGLTAPEVIDEIDGREVVRVRFPDQGHAAAQLRFSATRRAD